VSDHEKEILERKIEDLCREKEEIHFHKKKAEDDLKLALSVTEDLRQENQFLKGQIEAYRYCIDNIRR
jgi:hypothetical protein